MSQLHFYVPDDEEQRLRENAARANMSLSRYLAKLVREASNEPERWPEGYFDTVFGQWSGPPLERSAQGEPEDRIELE